MSSRKTSAQTSIDSRISIDKKKTGSEPIVLFRENQRVSLRVFLRTILENPQMAQTRAVEEFLKNDPITPSDADVEDISRRNLMDMKRVEEQKQFYEIARKRAAELDVYMEQLRQDIIENNGLYKILQEIKEKERVEDLSFQTQKLAEWIRIEVAATLYHIFLAEDNSPELFAQLKRIHSLIPYTIVKNAIRIANPAAVISSVLDIFLAKPFGARSLMQRIFSLTLNDGIRSLQKTVDAVIAQIDEPAFCDKLKKFVNADETIKNTIRQDSQDDSVDLIVAILRSELITPPLKPNQIGKIFNAYMAWNSAITNFDEEMKSGALLFSYLKQLLKLLTRQRDKAMMLSMVEEPVTLQLLRDIFTIFYEPLVTVYKTAGIHHRVMDFASFVDDIIIVVDRCREQDFSADPNQTVQAFIDLCERHQDNFYGFMHEVHLHDNGLFAQQLDWTNTILEFLRRGPKSGTLDMNALFSGAISSGLFDEEKAIEEINSLITWQEARKKWHQDKTRQKMAADGNASVFSTLPGSATFKSSDFGFDQMDFEEMNYKDGEESSSIDELEDFSPILAERRRRSQQVQLRRRAGEPVKPEISEIYKSMDVFLEMLRKVLAE